ncbi:Histidine phosphatase superfamily, clade-1 [Penicillium expansum]|uniref:Histidine phosphatase superfamily, clade-1 n=1 Tax=Penicillium expansum TaxID=27334 RepID=A0A0A2JZ08_PENEN|nr:Histidine phosphatase superfamily, clade-1 [Penicillium expansum]KGO48146.1 Histidine phosphatase superfamily, clade-1 [Penicillium expansum]KGO59888.1 Histidine phosphatase superfamily, clade-1 [Penicillium expansum]KGO68595.1 Histidine phosphatase superfamily, clade-1 [Penicillium expansum]
MKKSPPIVFIARHGARLDAADKDWHLTSPNPFDPPLSYGGWIQSRALGVRIGSLLKARQFTGEDPENQRSHHPTSDKQAKPAPAPSDLSHRYNVIIHTSPYLRCLQTAIGVSAGIHQQASGTEASEATSSAPTLPTVSSPPDQRCLLRVDAFLGEWLSPDYYDQITPPPGSDRMVASAKGELLRRAEVIPTTDGLTRALSGHFPGGWRSQSHPTSPDSEDHRLHSAKSRRQRASTHDTLQNPIHLKHAKKSLSRLETDLPPTPDTSYIPPTPTYAVSTSDPIPTGYVAHARNACTRIDYQWDSMRTPYWGTGGEFGEEWSTMHERVHDGFQHMINWYREQDLSDHGSTADSNEVNDSNAQTVLVIITHGADCNALISSLNGHSVLLDINTASLTMAVRRNRVNKPVHDMDHTPKSPGPENQSVSREYSLQLVASTDHLRPGMNPSQLTSLSSPPVPVLSPPPVPSYRNRLGARPSLLHETLTNGPPSTSPRAWTLAMRPSTGSINSPGASGLWNSISSPTDKADAEDNLVPNFGDRPVSQDSALSDKSDPSTDLSWTKQLPQRTLSQRGLWGSAQPLGDREGGTKRRWTVAEQKL